MAGLPAAHSKIWQMTGGLGSTLCIPLLNTAKAWLPVFINTLTAFPLFPYQVLGSSNATTAGMDGINRLATAADVVNVASGSSSPRSWVVYKNPATGVSYCIHCRPVGTGDGEVVISNSSLFTGGSTTARPTATDEIATTLAQFLLPSNIPKRMCVWHSADGLQTMAYTQATDLGVNDAVSAQWLFGKINNFPNTAVWTEPYWWAFGGEARMGLTAHELCGSGSFLSVLSRKPGGGRWTFGPYLTAEGVSPSGSPEPITYAMASNASTDGLREAQGFRFFVNSDSLLGYVGDWPDLYSFYRSEAEAWAPGGNGNFSSAAKTWCLIGGLAYPWDGVSSWVYP
jgi:hypothetical protein